MHYALSLTGGAMFGTGLLLALRELLNSGRPRFTNRWAFPTLHPRG
jgi:hypothetical protein